MPDYTSYYSVSEVAEACGCSTQAIRKAIKVGRLVAQKVGKQWVIADDEAQRFTESNYGEVLR